MSERERGKEIQTPKTFILINQQEFNLAALLDLLQAHNIKVINVAAMNPDPDSWRKIKEGFIPATWCNISVAATREEIENILLQSEEFKKHATKLLGSVWILL